MKNKENLKQLIAKVGAEIQPKLLPLPFHKKRNAYAHIYGAIKDILGASYSKADEEQVEKLVELIRESPNASYEELKEKLDE